MVWNAIKKKEETESVAKGNDQNISKLPLLLKAGKTI